MENEEDLTLSLGLRQVKPKRSFQQSLASLGTVRDVALPEKTEPLKTDKAHDEREEIETKKPREEKEEEVDDYVPSNIRLTYKEENYAAQLRQLSERLTAPKAQPTVQNTEKSTDINSTLIKLAEALQTRIETQQKNSNRQKKRLETEVKTQKLESAFKEAIRVSETRSRDNVKKTRESRESFSESESLENQKIIAVDASTIACLKQEIREIAQGFQVLQATMAQRPAGPGKRNTDDRIPEWLLTIQPRPHPYNVMTAIKKKLRAPQQKTPRDDEPQLTEKR